MAKNTTAEAQGRRKFIKRLLAVIPSTVVITSVAKAAPKLSDKQPVDPANEDGKGYRETDHIKKYYEKARF